MDVMELLEVVRPAARHGDFLRVPHSTTGLHRGLEHGEEVVVRTDDGEYHSAQVIGLDFELEDTVYDLRVGSRLPAEMAAERLGDAPLDEETKDVHRIVNMLARMRRRTRK